MREALMKKSLMREVSMEELKSIQLHILKAADRFCRQNGINYWLDYGTLLGAVRHQGYIPWDDDIDIGMMRADYEKFCSEFNGFSRRYQVLCLENDTGFIYPYAKVVDTETVLFEPDENGYRISVNIDVFPYDNAPDDIKKQNRMHAVKDILLALNSLRTYYGRPNGGCLRRMLIAIARVVLKVFPRCYFTKKIITHARKYEEMKTGAIGNFTTYPKAAGNRRIFKSLTKSIFEGSAYPVPGGWNEWLMLLYGDYMELPPADKRKSSHDFKAYIKARENERNDGGKT